MRVRRFIVLGLLVTGCGPDAGPATGQPDGRLAYRLANSVRVVELDGTEVASLPCHMSPSFSPDGSRIACLGTPGPRFLQQFQEFVQQLRSEFGDELLPERLRGFTFHGSINIANSDGTELRTVADQLAYFQVWWSRSGDRLFFQSGFGIDEQEVRASQVGSVGALFAVGVDGAKVNQLSRPVPLSLPPSLTWSEDLQWKVAPGVQSTAGELIHATPESLSMQQRIFLFPASSDEARRLTSEPGQSAHVYPSISPDGRQVAYNAVQRPVEGESDPQTALWLVDFSGEFGEQVAGDCRVSEWSTDGQRLLLSCRDSTVAVLEPATGAQIVLGEGRFPVFSPSGNWVAWVASEGDGHRIEIVPVGGGERRIVELPGPADQLEW